MSTVTDIGIRSLEIRDCKIGATIELTDKNDLRIMLAVTEPLRRDVRIADLFRIGRDSRRLTINPGESGYIERGTALRHMTTFTGPRDNMTASTPCGPLTVGQSAALAILGTDFEFVIVTIKRIHVHR